MCIFGGGLLWFANCDRPVLNVSVETVNNTGNNILKLLQTLEIVRPISQFIYMKSIPGCFELVALSMEIINIIFAHTWDVGMF